MVYQAIALTLIVTAGIGWMLYLLSEMEPRSYETHHRENVRNSQPLPRQNSTWNGRKNEDRDTKVDKCVICLESISMETKKNLDCGHNFHKSCIRRWFQEHDTCPQCRRSAK